MSNERDKEIAANLIHQIKKERGGHFTGDCAGDACADWIARQAEIVVNALTTARKEARAEAWRDAAQKLRDKADDWRSQSERWQRNAENAGMDIIREQDYADRDACLSKMAAAITLAIEFDEAAATTQKGDNDETVKS